MAYIRCLMPDVPGIARLARQTGLTKTQTAAAVSLWQDDNDVKNYDTYPSAQQLKDYIEKLKEQEYELKVSVRDYNELVELLGKEFSDGIQLGNLYPTLKNSDKPAKKEGWIQSGDNDLLRLIISREIDARNIGDAEVLKRIKWLRPGERLLLYEKYSGRKINNPAVKALARNGLSNYKTNARLAQNEEGEYKFILETRSKIEMRQARMAFTYSQYTDRIREVAQLFSKTMRDLIKIERELNAERYNELTMKLRESPESYKGGKGSKLDQERKKYISAVYLLDKPDRNKVAAMRLIGGPAAVVKQMHKVLDGILNNEKYTNNDDAFLDKISQVFGITIGSRTKAEIKEYREQLQKIADNIDKLVQDAAPEIKEAEGITILRTARDSAPVNPDDYNPDDAAEYKESWMYKYDSVDRFEEAPFAVKKLIATLPIRMDKSGREKKTMFGATAYYNRGEVLQILHEKFLGIYDSPSMIAKLRELAESYPWANDILTTLNQDDNLRTNFFRNFCLAQKLFSGIVETKKGLKLIKYGTEEVVRGPKDMALANISNGEQLSTSMSLYTTKGGISRTGVLLAGKKLSRLQDALDKWAMDRYPGDNVKFENLQPEEARIYVEDNPTILEDIADILNGFGFPVNSNNVNNIIQSPTVEGGFNNNLSMLMLDLSWSIETLKRATEGKNRATIRSVVSKQLVNTSNALTSKEEFRGKISPMIEDKDGDQRMTFVQPSLLDRFLQGFRGELYRGFGKGHNQMHRNEEPKEFLERIYGKDKFYKNPDGTWRLRFFRDLVEGNEDAQKIDYTEILDAYDKPYKKWTGFEMMQILYDMFHSEGLYRLPITSDNQALRLVKMPKYEHDEIVSALVEIMWQEYDRFQNLQQIGNDNYQNNIATFCFIENLNRYEFKVNSKVVGKGMQGFQRVLDLSETTQEANTIFRQAIEDILSIEVDKLKTDYSRIQDNFTTDIFEKEANIQTFVENNYLAQLTMLEMFAGDLAFYKNYEELQKRFKQIITPIKPLDVDNPNGQREQRCLYVVDPSILSPSDEKLRTLWLQELAAERMTKEQYLRLVSLDDESEKRWKEDIAAGRKKEDEYIKEKMENGRVRQKAYTDGQIFRSLLSHMRLRHMLGTASDDTDRAIYRIVNNIPQADDMNVHLEVQKLFGAGLIDYSTDDNDILSPFQHKSSEQVLLPPFMEASLTHSSPLLAALYNVMSAKNIDEIVFTSVTKLGNNGSIVLPEGYLNMSREELYKNIMESIDKAEFNPVHTIPTENIGTVSYLPEHGIDRIDNVGSQLMTLMSSDLSDDAMFNLKGVGSVSKAEVLSRWNALFTEKIKRAYEELVGKVADMEVLSAMLHDAAEVSKRSDSLLDRVFELDEYGNFTVPLCNLSNLRLSSSVLNAVIHKAVGKLQMNGGQYVQATSLGVENNLKLNVTQREDGTYVYESMDCYMPAWTQKLVKEYMKENGVLDIARMPEDLLKAIGYRIPTQGKNFMIPLRIKGFVPQLSGSIIVLPADFMYMSDSDFDADKVYVLLPSYEDNEDGTISAAEVDHTSNVTSLSDGSINNSILDIMHSILTSEFVVAQSINTGGKESVNAAAAKMEALLGEKPKKQPGSITDVVNQAVQNNDGKNIIEVAAAANSSHAIAQHSAETGDPNDILRVELPSGEIINMFGKQLSSLAGQTDYEGFEYISKQIGDAIGASADNAEDATLHKLDINGRTASVAFMLLRLGLSVEEVATFLNIPTIREYANHPDPKKYRESKGIYPEDSFNFSPPNGLAACEEQIRKGVDYNNGLQVAALKTFLSLNNVASELFSIDNTVKNNTGSGVPHGDLASNIARIVQYRQFERKASEYRYIKGWSSLFRSPQSLEDYTVEDLARLIKRAAAPVAQGFTSYALFGGYDIMKQFFPLLGNENFIDSIVNILGNKRATVDNIRPIIYAAYQFAQSRFDAWLRNDPKTGKKMTSQETLEWYIKEFPDAAVKMINKHPDLIENPLIQRLSFGASDIHYPFIDLLYVDDDREMYTHEWLKLTEHPSAEVRQFAKDLYIYEYYKTGFIPKVNNGGRSNRKDTNVIGSFGWLAPVEVMESIDGLLAESGDIEAISAQFDPWVFEVLYIRNNLADVDMVPDYAKSPFLQYEAQTGEKVKYIEDAPSELSVPGKKRNRFGVGTHIERGYGFYYYKNQSSTPRKSFAIELEDGPVFYIYNQTDDKYYKVDPLGWRGRAVEYSYTDTPYSKKSIYDDNLILIAEKALSGTDILEYKEYNEEQDAIEVTEATPEQDKPFVAQEDTGDISNPKQYYKLEFIKDWYINEAGEAVNEIYVYDKRPDLPIETGWDGKPKVDLGRYIFFDAEGKQINDFAIYQYDGAWGGQWGVKHIGNKAYKRAGLMYSRSNTEDWRAAQLNEDDEWLRKHLGKMNMNKKKTDVTGEEICAELGDVEF